ncbi:MAG: adenylyltransferase/cytidyltransferase family protein, partial [Spirochaetaceae bacterium]
MEEETHGVIIGRFMPPHAGHQYLVDFGRNMCSRLTVFVCTLDSEPIDGRLRFRWMQELFPEVEMVHITEEIPEARKDSPMAVPIWARTIRTHLAAPPSLVFASEDYGASLARELGARFVPVDPARRQFPVSATMIRENPLANWDYIPEPVRPYFLRRVSIAEPVPEPEAGGPGTDGDVASLARRLAAHYHTLFVSDYGRFFESAVGPVTRENLDLVRSAQRAVEEALARRASRVLFCEADLLQIALRRGFDPARPTPIVGRDATAGDAAERERADTASRYDLTLIVMPRGGGRATGRSDD